MGDRAGITIEVAPIEPMQELQPQPISFKLSVNRNWLNKPKDGEADISQGWYATEFTLADLRQHIEYGYTVNRALLQGSKREDKAFVSSQLLFVDIDNQVRAPEGKIFQQQLTVKEALQLPIVRDHAAYLYYSPSHTKKWPRFRIVWIAPIPIDDPETYKILSLWVNEQIPGGDKAATSITNLFYGAVLNQEFDPPLYCDRTFPLDWIDQAIAWHEDRQEKHRASRKTLSGSTGGSPRYGTTVSLRKLLGQESERIQDGGFSDRSDAAMRLLLDYQGCENWCAQQGVPYETAALDEWLDDLTTIYSGENERYIERKADRLIESAERGHGPRESWQSAIVHAYGDEGLWKRIKAEYPDYRDRSEDRYDHLDLEDDSEAVLASSLGKVAVLPGVEAPREGDDVLRKARDLDAYIAEVLQRRELSSFQKVLLVRHKASELRLKTLIKDEELSRQISKVNAEMRGIAAKPIFPGDRVSRPVILPDLVQGLIPARNLTLLTGAPKGGKTQFAVGLIKALLAGKTFIGLETRFKGSVLWIHDDQSDEDTFLQCEKAGLINHDRLVTWGSWSTDRLNELEDMLADPRLGKNPFVLIDSLTSISRYSGIDENSPMMGAALYDLKETLNAAGATSLMIHHSNKGGAGLNSVRGSTSITAAAANVLTLNLLNHKIDGVTVEDRHNPKRRLSASLRRSSMEDCVVEMHFDSLDVDYCCTWSEWQQEQRQEQAASEAQADEMGDRILMFVRYSSSAQSRTQIAAGVLGTTELRNSDRTHTADAQKVYRRIDKLVKGGLLFKGKAEKSGLYHTDIAKLESAYPNEEVEFE